MRVFKEEGKTFRVDKERLGLRFGLGVTNQDRRKTRLTQGRVRFRVISVHVTQATSQLGITNQEVYMAMVTRRVLFSNRVHFLPKSRSPAALLSELSRPVHEST
jgi:hypothetical protein